MEAPTMNTATESTVHSFIISEEERAELIRLLESAVGENRVEIHRTHTPDYRDRVLSEQALLRGLLDKFQHMRTYE
jgi:hypothetical protein